MPAAESVFRQEFPVRGGDFAKAGAAACEIKELLKDLGLDTATVRRAAIVAYEAEMNVIMYARRGPDGPGRLARRRSASPSTTAARASPTSSWP